MSLNATQRPRLLSITDVAERLAVSRRTIQRKVYSGELPAYRLGGPRTPIRIDEQELEQWLALTPGRPNDTQGCAPLRRRSAPARTFDEWRADGDHAELATRAFWRWATSQALDDGIDPERDVALEEQRVLSKASSGGGFLVPSDVSEMITAAARAASAVAQVATEIVTERGERSVWLSQGRTARAPGRPRTRATRPPTRRSPRPTSGAFKATTKIIVSEELRTDEAVELDAYLSFELGGRLGALQETAFVTGDGSGKPLGIVHASSPYTVVNAATGSATTYKLADLKAVFKALPQAFRRTATWLINGDDFAELAALTDTAGGPVLPSLQFDPPSLFGRPVLLSADLPAPAASAKSLALGEWKRAYGVRRVRGISMQRQDELHSDTGQVGYKLFARSDGRPLLADAARILAHSAT